MKLTIERERWLRGEGPTKSYLLRQEDQKMCCLGFFACALGANPDDIASVQTPQNMWDFFSEKAPWTISGIAATDDENSGECLELMRANDNPRITLTDGDREKVIADIFAKHDVQVEFV